MSNNGFTYSEESYSRPPREKSAEPENEDPASGGTTLRSSPVLLCGRLSSP